MDEFIFTPDGVYTQPADGGPMVLVHAYKNSPGNRITALEAQRQQADDAAIELYEAHLAQQEINAAQDDALIELYEMIGG